MDAYLKLWIALFATGILGSLHCVGMCGPLALSLPMPAGKRVVPGRLLYQGGRILSYMSIGVIFGLLGNTIVLAGYQQYISIFAGVILLIMALYRLLHLERYFALTGKFSNWISRNLSSQFQKGTDLSLLFTGILNGYLPCGLVYAAGAMSVTLGNPMHAAVGMGLFGLGTFPVMFVMSMGRRWLPAGLRIRFQTYSTYFALVIGVLFVLRGMNLGIPYISPKVDMHTEQMECCEH